MEAHITENAQKLLEEKNQLIEAYRENMRKVQSSSITAGAKAVLNVVLQKARATDKSSEDKINEIINYCAIGLGKGTNTSEK